MSSVMDEIDAEQISVEQERQHLLRVQAIAAIKEVATEAINAIRDQNAIVAPSREQVLSIVKDWYNALH